MGIDCEIKTIDELSELLKEIYGIINAHTMSQRSISTKYGISQYAIQDLKCIDIKYLEPDKLQEILKLIKNSSKMQEVGAEFGIGNNVLGFIRKKSGIKRNEINKSLKKDENKSSFENAQQVWIRVKNGENINNIAKDMKIELHLANEYLYMYSKLLKALHETYKRHRNVTVKDGIVKKYKDSYNLSDDAVDYIKCGEKNINIDNAIKTYMKSQGIDIEDGGEEHE